MKLKNLLLASVFLFGATASSVHAAPTDPADFSQLTAPTTSLAPLAPSPAPPLVPPPAAPGSLGTLGGPSPVPTTAASTAAVPSGAVPAASVPPASVPPAYGTAPTGSTSSAINASVVPQLGAPALNAPSPAGTVPPLVVPKPVPPKPLEAPVVTGEIMPGGASAADAPKADASGQISFDDRVKDAAGRLVLALHYRDEFDHMGEAYIDRYTEYYSASNPGNEKTVRKIVEAKFQPAMNQLSDKLLIELRGLYADKFSYDELIAMLQFYKSPIGVSIAGKTALLHNAFVDQSSKDAMEFEVPALRSVAAELKAEGLNVPTKPQDSEPK